MSEQQINDGMVMVRRLWSVLEQMRMALAWRWVLNPSMLEPILRNTGLDTAVLYDPEQGYYQLLGRPVRLDDNVTTITVEWPEAE